MLFYLPSELQALPLATFTADMLEPVPRTCTVSACLRLQSYVQAQSADAKCAERADRKLHTFMDYSENKQLVTRKVSIRDKASCVLIAHRLQEHL